MCNTAQCNTRIVLKESFSTVKDHLGLPDFCSSCTYVLPLSYSLHQTQTCFCDITCISYTHRVIIRSCGVIYVLEFSTSLLSIGGHVSVFIGNFKVIFHHSNGQATHSFKSYSFFIFLMFRQEN